MMCFLKRVLFLGVAILSVNSFAAVNAPTLSTNGYAEMAVTPDMAIFTVAVQEERSQASQAKQAVDSVVNKFTSALNAKGIERKDISSGNLYISPRYTYSSPQNGKLILNGYQAVRYITVNVAQLEDLNGLLDVALSAGINRVDNIQLKAKDEALYQQQVRAAAIADAKEKAQVLASGFDAKLDGVWSINYYNNNARPVIMSKSVMAREMRSVDQTYQDQTMTISDRVDVVFKLKN